MTQSDKKDYFTTSAEHVRRTLKQMRVLSKQAATTRERLLFDYVDDLAGTLLSMMEEMKHQATIQKADEDFDSLLEGSRG